MPTLSNQDMIDELKRLDNLTVWEIYFVESIDTRLRWGRELTEAQEDKLRAIWNERS